MVAGVVLYFLLISCWVPWHGGYCFGPRYLVPLLPLIMIGLLRAKEVLGSSVWSNGAAAVLLVLSIQINALGALPYWRFWGEHPLATLFQ